MIDSARTHRLGPLGFFLLLFGPVAASAVFLVWTRVTTLRLGYELAGAQADLQRLEKENRALGTTVSALRSPERLRELARELGLEPPLADQVAVTAPNEGMAW